MLSLRTEGVNRFCPVGSAVVTDDHSDAMAPRPSRGRVYRRTRCVRLGDASPGGRLRLDALTRYLQDVSNDDTRDAGYEDEMGWVVRRIAIDVERFPVFGEELALDTFCSATGGRWAERRVIVEGDRGGWADAATLWVHVDAAGRPKPLPDRFHELFGEAAGGRTVRARLQHPDRPGPAATVHAWPVRFVDFDMLGHMNNAAYWAAVEEELSRRRHLRAPLRAEVEFRAAIEPHVRIDAVSEEGPDGVRVWLCGDAGVYATALLRSRA
jgi:acyl-ACP thioesterase